jgi:hypothetical protein
LHYHGGKSIFKALQDLFPEVEWRKYYTSISFYMPFVNILLIFQQERKRKTGVTLLVDEGSSRNLPNKITLTHLSWKIGTYKEPKLLPSRYGIILLLFLKANNKIARKKYFTLPWA